MLTRKTLDETCPHCGGEVLHTYIGADCRGNPPTASNQCKDCNTYLPLDTNKWNDENESN